MIPETEVMPVSNMPLPSSHGEIEVLEKPQKLDPVQAQAAKELRKGKHFRGNSFGAGSAIVADERSPGKNVASLYCVKEETEQEAEEGRVGKLE